MAPTGNNLAVRGQLVLGYGRCQFFEPFLHSLADVGVELPELFASDVKTKLVVTVSE